MTNKSLVVMALYQPKAGKNRELEDLVHQHFPTLKEYGLTTNREPLLARSTNGTILEIFEWISEDAAKKAHEHPAVAKIWEAMAMVCEFSKLQDLPESKKLFPSFQRAF